MADSSRCYRTSSGKRLNNLDRRSVVDGNEAENASKHDQAANRMELEIRVRRGGRGRI
jgi:hypothetical protein